MLDRNSLDPVFLSTVAVFAFLPQLCMAVIGSLLGLSLAWSARSRAMTITLFAMVGIPILNLAAWLAVWNALPAQPPWLPFGVTPGGLLLQLGLFSLIRNRGCRWRRSFWVGFVVVDSLVFWSYLQAMIFTHVQTARYLTYWPNGPWYARPIPEAPLWTLWIDYTALASYALGQQPHGTYIVAWTNDQTVSVVYMLVVLLPHLLAAFGGGRWRRSSRISRAFELPVRNKRVTESRMLGKKRRGGQSRSIMPDTIPGPRYTLLRRAGPCSGYSGPRPVGGGGRSRRCPRVGS